MKVFLNFWIKKDTHNYLGRGKIQLLKYIQETGSLSQAAKKMKMSYKAAWDDIQTINTHSPKPVVETIVGGKNGGGSKISDYGIELIKTFESLQDLILKIEKKLDNFEDIDTLKNYIQDLENKLLEKT
ncbi:MULTISPECIES: winged helix-turn-helix domain-containing protein [unclassified Helicobacter]|uniref:winged helix-turn-helix domain-containing protein n=1 Tax=unclassified Helicobacter TaxID=2593540 RepID=UPI000CF0F098|nr:MULTISPECIES: winged helix-turn-helix domain-containing protein [unclassified Helicobacter]